jgi:limonene-1,2-epoxide hydrolase
MAHTENIHVVKALFAALVDGDIATAQTLVADDIAWLNTKLPTVRGKGVRRILDLMPKIGMRFAAEKFDFADNGDGTVRFDRRDTLRWGPVRTAFDVSGTFLVRDGKVARWDDRYRMGEVIGGVFRRSCSVRKWRKAPTAEAVGAFRSDQMPRTFSACGPLGPATTSNSTFWFSSSDL